jgi:flagellar biogenesis protein FliO
MLSRLAFGMGVVIVTCFGMVWACKRWLKTGTLPGEVGSQLRVVERLMLGPRCSVFLLQSGRCRVLAGVDGSGLQALVPLSEPFEDALTEAGETPSDAAAP